MQQVNASDCVFLPSLKPQISTKPLQKSSIFYTDILDGLINHNMSDLFLVISTHDSYTRYNLIAKCTKIVKCMSSDDIIYVVDANFDISDTVVSSNT